MRCKKCGAQLMAQVSAQAPVTVRYFGHSQMWEPVADLCMHEADTGQHMAEALAQIATVAGASYRTEQLGNGSVRHILVFDQSAESVAQAATVEAGA